MDETYANATPDPRTPVAPDPVEVARAVDLIRWARAYVSWADGSGATIPGVDYVRTSEVDAHLRRLS